MVVGWQGGNGGRRQSIGALLLAQSTEAGWYYVGRVGWIQPGRAQGPEGAVGATGRRPPATGAPYRGQRELTGPSHLRHPSWRGLRLDKVKALLLTTRPAANHDAAAQPPRSVASVPLLCAVCCQALRLVGSRPIGGVNGRPSFCVRWTSSRRGFGLARTARPASLTLR